MAETVRNVHIQTFLRSASLKQIMICGRMVSVNRCVSVTTLFPILHIVTSISQSFSFHIGREMNGGIDITHQMVSNKHTLFNASAAVSILSSSNTSSASKTCGQGIASNQNFEI